MNEPENEEPWFNPNSWIDLVAMAFSLWFCWYFVGAPTKAFLTDWLQSDQLDRPKDQQRLP